MRPTERRLHDVMAVETQEAHAMVRQAQRTAVSRPRDGARRAVRHHAAVPPPLPHDRAVAMLMIDGEGLEQGHGARSHMPAAARAEAGASPTKRRDDGGLVPVPRLAHRDRATPL